jgi:hypothetical protein
LLRWRRRFSVFSIELRHAIIFSRFTMLFIMTFLRMLYADAMPDADAIYADAASELRRLTPPPPCRRWPLLFERRLLRHAIRMPFSMPLRHGHTPPLFSRHCDADSSGLSLAISFLCFFSLFPSFHIAGFTLFHADKIFIFPSAILSSF